MVSDSGGLPPICILAGGRGTRLGELVEDVPKPLVAVAGEPFLIHQLRLLRAFGASHVVLAVGYLGEMIERRIGSEQFGIQVSYSHDGPELLGTLGAIRRALPLLGDRFLVLYGDTYLRLDYRAAVEAWIASDCAALMTVFYNEGRWDSSNAIVNDDRIVAYDKFRPTPEMKWIDYGMGGLTPAGFEYAEPEMRDLASLYTLLAQRGDLCAYEVTERFYEIGTPAALSETDAFLSGKPGVAEN